MNKSTIWYLLFNLWLAIIAINQYSRLGEEYVKTITWIDVLTPLIIMLIFLVLSFYNKRKKLKGVGRSFTAFTDKWIKTRWETYRVKRDTRRLN